MDGFRIGQLSKLSGVPTGTIRFYERKGLLPTPPRTAAGYRTYPAEFIDRLKLVLSIKALGFSLEEVAEFLAGSERESTPCRKQHCRASAKMHELDRRILELQFIRGKLQGLVSGCGSSARNCLLLDAGNPAGKLAALIAAVQPE